MSNLLPGELEILSLENNDPIEYIEAIDIILRLLENIINHPRIPKYRTIKLDNPKIKSKLLSLNGMKEIMIKIGFLEVLINI